MMEITNGFDKKVSKKDYELIDSAWDDFSDYIGEHNIQTPLTLKQFESLFKRINKDGKYSEMKNHILESFQCDSYIWPLVERDND